LTAQLICSYLAARLREEQGPACLTVCPQGTSKEARQEEEEKEEKEDGPEQPPDSPTGVLGISFSGPMALQPPQAGQQAALAELRAEQALRAATEEAVAAAVAELCELRLRLTDAENMVHSLRVVNKELHHELEAAQSQLQAHEPAQDQLKEAFFRLQARLRCATARLAEAEAALAQATQGRPTGGAAC
jgi:hypothetical protein